MISTMNDLINEYDRLPLKEHRYSSIAIETTDGFAYIDGFVIDGEGRVLIKTLCGLKIVPSV